MTNKKYTVISVLGGIAALFLLISILTGIVLLGHFALSTTNTMLGLNASVSGTIDWLNRPLTDILIAPGNISSTQLSNDTNNTISIIINEPPILNLSETNAIIVNTENQTFETNNTNNITNNTILEIQSETHNLIDQVFLGILWITVIFMVVYILTILRP